MEPKYLFRQFEDCCVACGYSHSSGRSELAETFGSDLKEILTQIFEQFPDAHQRLEALMHLHANPWVQHYCAMVLIRKIPEKAVPVLERLSQDDGLWAPLSQVILGTWQQMQKLS